MAGKVLIKDLNTLNSGCFDFFFWHKLPKAILMYQYEISHAQGDVGHPIGALCSPIDPCRRIPRQTPTEVISPGWLLELLEQPFEVI